MRICLPTAYVGLIFWGNHKTTPTHHTQIFQVTPIFMCGKQSQYSDTSKLLLTNTDRDGYFRYAKSQLQNNQALVNFDLHATVARKESCSDCKVCYTVELLVLRSTYSFSSKVQTKNYCRTLYHMRIFQTRRISSTDVLLEDGLQKC